MPPRQINAKRYATIASASNWVIVVVSPANAVEDDVPKVIPTFVVFAVIALAWLKVMPVLAVLAVIAFA